MIKKNRYLLYFILFILITIGLLACINKATTQKEYTTISKSDSTVIILDTLSKREFLGSRLILDLLPEKRYSHLELIDSLNSAYSIFYNGSKLEMKNQKFVYTPLKKKSGIFSYFNHFNFKQIYIFPFKEGDIFKKVLFCADSAIGEEEEQEKILLPRLDIVSIREDGKKIDELNLYYSFSDGITANEKLFFIDEETNIIYSITGYTDEGNTQITDKGYEEYWIFDKIKKYTITEKGEFRLNE